MRRAALLALLPLLALARTATEGPKPDRQRSRDRTCERARACGTLPLLTLLKGGPTAAQLAAGSLAGVTVVRATSKACSASSSTVTFLSANQPCVEPLGLLIEPAHTNVILRSQELDDAAWILSGTSGGGSAQPSVTANATAAPDGTTTAELLSMGAAVTGTINDQQLILQDVASLAAGTYTFSIWTKAATGVSSIRLFLKLQSDVLAAAQVGTCPVGAAWQRCSVSLTTGSTATLTSLVGWRGDIATSPQGTLYLWGAQLETSVGQPRSYVATTSASASTGADVVTMSAAKLPIASGTFSVNFAPRWTDGSPLRVFWWARSTVGLSMKVVSNTIIIEGDSAGTAVVQGSAGTWVVDQPYRVAIRWGAGNATLTKDTTIGTRTDGAGQMPSGYPAAFELGSTGGSFFIDGHLSNLVVTR